MRQIAHAFTAEMVEPAQGGPLAPHRGEHHLEGRCEFSEFVVCPRGQGQFSDTWTTRLQTALRNRIDGTGEQAQRPCHRSNDPCRQQGGEQHHPANRSDAWLGKGAAKHLQPVRRQFGLAAHQVQVTGHRLVIADQRTAQGARRNHRVGVHALRVVTHHEGHVRASNGLQHRCQRNLEAGGQLGLAGGRQHHPLRVEQIELRIGLKKDQVAQELVELLRLARMQIEQVVVHGHHAPEEHVGSVESGLMLKALERKQHRGNHT